MRKTNILFIEAKLCPTSGGIQRVSFLLGEALKGRGYNTYYAYHIANTDTELVETGRKLLFDIKDSENSLFEMFSNFILTHHIDLLWCQVVFSEKMINVYRRLRDKHNLKIVSCLHSNPDKAINKNSLTLTPFSIYLKSLLKSILYGIKGNPQISEMRNVYNVSDCYVLLSDRFIPIFRNLLGIPAEPKLIAIGNPCSFKSLPNVQVKKENSLLVVGRMEENQKRISNILMVWKTICRKYPEWKLDVVGDGSSLNSYKKYADKHRLERITFHGASSNVEEFYSKSKIFLMTSIWEGWGMTLLEAQSFGCVPVVFDNYAAVHDIIDGKNGIVVESNNLAAFIKATEGLMQNHEKHEMMARYAKTSVREKYTINKIIDKWQTLLNSM